MVGQGVQGMLRQMFMIVIAWTFMIYYQQDTMIYHPKKYDGELDMNLVGEGLVVDPLPFQTEDGAQNALLLRCSTDGEEGQGVPAASIKRLYLVFGGNAMTARNWLSIISRQPSIVAKDAALVLVDYPGYGASEGSPSRESIVRTGQQALQAAQSGLTAELSEEEREDADLKIGAIGHSIGCAAAMAVAAAQLEAGTPLQHLVLSAPFTSLAEMAQSLLSVLKIVPVPLIAQLTSQHAWDNLADANRLAGSAAPTVDIMHGDEDEIVPHRMGTELHEYLRSLGFQSSMKTDQAHHNDLLGSATYLHWLEGLLS
eukprot:TRINITY_DN58871_c0_g1_i1.p1 TRINITY_DN58871_c0_g1~~TRINITY_DN58871_c0_g1_i1.p1  ORF type:complete len:313 (+),score=73.33 TRINITY_DN58871_c0_g1_i1:104-1042(+)